MCVFLLVSHLRLSQQLDDTAKGDSTKAWTQPVLSWSRQFRKCPPVSSCLVSFKTSSGMQTSARHLPWAACIQTGISFFLMLLPATLDLLFIRHYINCLFNVLNSWPIANVSSLHILHTDGVNHLIRLVIHIRTVFFLSFFFRCRPQI